MTPRSRRVDHWHVMRPRCVQLHAGLLDPLCSNKPLQSVFFIVFRIRLSSQPLCCTQFSLLPMAPKGIAELLGLGKANISVSDGKASKNSKHEMKQEKKTDDAPKETPKKKPSAEKDTPSADTSSRAHSTSTKKKAVQQRPMKERKKRQCRLQRKRGE